jgi:hypothetical protein
MRIFRKYKAGAYAAPAFVILFYFLFVVLDLFTTYLASPDLEFEGNIFINYFKLNWNQIIFLAAFFTILLACLLIFASKYVHSFFRINSINKKFSDAAIVRNKRIILSYFAFSCFYSHFFCSIFLSINNYLSYIYLFGIQNIFTSISIKYLSVGARMKPYFFLYAYVFFVIMAFLFAYFNIKQIREKYKKISA